MMTLMSAPGATQALDYHRQEIVAKGISRQVSLPSGLRLELLTEQLDAPRMLTFADNGELLVGSRSGNIYRLRAPYTRPETLLRLDDYPHSVALRSGEMLIAQSHGLYSAPYRPGQDRIPSETVSLTASLPGGGSHSSRTVAVGPDQRVYVSLGISGNCSDEYLGEGYPFERTRGGILVLREEQGQPHLEPFGSGLRNPVGFDWHPVNGALYAGNNGPDHLGYEQPPEYFSRVEPGSFHGMPWFQFDGERLRRDNCIERPAPRPLEQVTSPAATFPARSAPMGVAFIPDEALLPELSGDAVVALHGSWATRPTGGPWGSPATRRPPKLVRVKFREGIPQQVEDLISGFQESDGERWARPVGVAVGPDGALYFTSDEGVHGLFRLNRNP
jgi:glucose/arabinose dehydrogenase